MLEELKSTTQRCIPKRSTKPCQFCSTSIFYHYRTISVSFVHFLRYQVTNNSFILFFLSGRVWKSFRKMTTGDFKEELTIIHIDVSSTSYLDPRISLFLILIPLTMLNYYLTEFYCRKIYSPSSSQWRAICMHISFSSGFARRSMSGTIRYSQNYVNNFNFHYHQLC